MSVMQTVNELQTGRDFEPEPYPCPSM